MTLPTPRSGVHSPSQGPVMYSRSSRQWVEDSPLGPLTVAVGAAGVRSVVIGGVSVAGDPEPGVSGAFQAYFAGDLDALDEVPVDLEGRSPFCRQVLLALARIRPGQVVTYGGLGAAIGRPSAARAVGRAVGSNPVPVVIPCHRVVAGNGSLGGYSGGLDVKRWLLAHEGVPSFTSQ